MRATMHHIPTTRDVLSQMKQPLAVFVQPMAATEEGEMPVPMVDLTEGQGGGPVRCTRCKGYVNPFVKWLNNGQQWLCNLCHMTNTTPSFYRCPLDGAGLRVDANSRPELSCGSVDFVATKDYCVRPVQEPMYIFVVDTSPPAISSGFTALVLAAAVNAVEQTLAQCQANPDEGLQRSGYGATPIFAGGKRAKVGLVSFDNVVTFYRSSGGEFGNVVMSDIEDPFAALPPSEWLVALDDAPRAVVGKVGTLADHILKHAAAGASTGATGNGSTMPASCGCAAIQSVASALHDTGGRMLYFSHSTPLLGKGRLRPRSSANDYGTDREVDMYRPLTPKETSKAEREVGELYRNLATVCSRRQVCLHLFLTDGGGICDVATLGQLARATGGQTHFLRTSPGSVPSNSDKEGKRPLAIGELTAESMRAELAIVLAATSANESVLKVRCSPGLRCTEYRGSGVQHNSMDEFDMAACDRWTCCLCTIKHDGGAALSTNEKVHGRSPFILAW
jgi:protein transport protein SEC24